MLAAHRGALLYIRHKHLRAQEIAERGTFSRFDRLPDVDARFSIEERQSTSLRRQRR